MSWRRRASSPAFAEGWLNRLELMQAVIGDDSRVANAFEGVSVSPYEKAPGIIATGRSQLRFKQSEGHFPNWTGSIFR